MNSAFVDTFWKKWWAGILLVVIFAGCNPSGNTYDNAIVKVYDKILYVDQLHEIVPKSYKGIDSVAIVDRYIQEWVNKELVLQKALINIAGSTDIEQMVMEYRNSLIVSKYMELLVAEKSDAVLEDKEIAGYYNDNPESFPLEEMVVRGVFIKIPVESPRLESITKWMKDRTEEDLMELEDYCLQNAQIYEDFSDKWLPVNAINNYTPEPIDEKAFKPGVTIEQADSLSLYYTMVFDVLNKDMPAPLVYIRPQLVRILQHKKKLEFISGIKKDILNEAIENKKVIYYDKK